MKPATAVAKIHAILKHFNDPKKIKVMQAVAALSSGFYVEESA